MTPSLATSLQFTASKGISYAHHLLKRGSVNFSHRRAVIAALAALPDIPQESVAKRVIIDGMYDNPNHWLRLALTQRALGLGSARATGVTTIFTAREVRRTFAALGIRESVSWERLLLRTLDVDAEANRAIRQISNPEDILKLDMPFGFPASLIYDGVLKRQRRAVVDVRLRRFPIHMVEAFRSLHAADRLFDRVKPDLIVTSHHINFSFGSLAWAAIRRNIPVIVMYGYHGSLRFFRPRTAADLFDFMDRPVAEELDRLEPVKAEQLRAAGASYMQTRLNGKTTDIGALYAFGRQPNIGLTRAGMVAHFNWDPAKPIVAVYTGNWFDNVHGCGMTHFRDLMDWLKATLQVAASNDHCNWLLRGHPCDEWFESVRLPELLPERRPTHVGLAPESWNGSEVLGAADAVVSYHSTASLEYACVGKPALVADRGWYHDCGFAVWPKSREEYLELLASPWWERVERDKIKARAEFFSGWFFSRVEKDMIWREDSVRDDLYRHIATLPEEQTAALDREMQRIRDWFQSGTRHLHTFAVPRNGAVFV